jgi:hypothetical protein
MNYKDKGLTGEPKGQEKVQPLEITIKPKELEFQFNNILTEAVDFEPVLPKGVSVPALVPDFAGDVPGVEPEPVYGSKVRGNIQGNIIPGFNKDHQHFLFYRLGNIKQAKEWLHWISPLITSMEEVIAFAEVIVIGNPAEEFRKVRSIARPEQTIIDLVRITNDRVNDGRYQGICW